MRENKISSMLLREDIDFHSISPRQIKKTELGMLMESKPEC